MNVTSQTANPASGSPSHPASGSSSSPVTERSDATGNSPEGDSPVTAEIAAAAHSAVDTAAENLKRAEKALKEARAAAGHKASETAEQAQYFSEEMLNSVETYVHQYPLRSLGIALASGYLLSTLLKK